MPNDFDALDWSKQPTDGPVSQAIRRDVRKHRRERGRGGHRFSLNYLKTVWSASDGSHVVLNHVDDLIWQMWYRHPEQGWVLMDWLSTRREAQAAAETHQPELSDSRPDMPPGIYVLAAWPGRPSTMRVHCSSERTADDITEVFARLGCDTQRELVDASLG